MADQGDSTEKQRDPRLVRDFIALLLVVLGAVCALLAGWIAGPVAGFAVSAGLLITSGLALGMDR